MKICWNNLENIEYKNNNFHYNNRKYFYKDSCKSCNNPFLSSSNIGIFCNGTCQNMGKNNPMFGKYGKENHFYGKKHSEETKQKIGNREYKYGNKHQWWKGGISKKNIPLYDTFANQINYAEKVRNNDGRLEVKCTYCGKWFMPKTTNVQNRIGSLNGYYKGENRLYCSTTCKKECPIYRKQKYSAEENNTKQYSREVQPELRQMVLKRDNYTCQNPECKATESLHCHHKEGIRWEPLESADIDMCITYCKDCHKAVHKKDGCGYYEMRCAV